MTKANKLTEKPMPIRWEQIIDLMPQHNWQITPAALAVGYKPRYVESTLLRTIKDDARFCTAVEVKKAQLASKHNIKSSRLVAEWKKLAFSNIEDFIVCSAEGEFTYKSWARIPRDILAAVESVKITTNVLTKKQHIHLKLYSKAVALEHLGKICGAYELDNDQRRSDVKLQIIQFTMQGCDADGRPPISEPTI